MPVTLDPKFTGTEEEMRAQIEAWQRSLELAVKEKHLSGQHDQGTHAHGGGTGPDLNGFNHPTPDARVAHYSRETEAWQKGLSPEERQFARNMVGNRMQANRALRAGEEPPARSVETLDTLTGPKAYTLKHDVEVYRGVAMPEGQRSPLKEGTTIRDKGYAYTTTDKELARVYATFLPGSAAKTPGKVATIKLAKGTKVALGITGQEEMILARGHPLTISKLENA